MKLITQSSLLFSVAGNAFALPRSAPNSQISSREDRVQVVIEAFQTSWKGYYETAFPHDTLRPVSGGYEDDRNEWGVTAFDALSTAILMDQVEIVQQILDFVPTVNFTTTKKVDGVISLFETNIRYLGGLLSGYDLLKGPKKGLVPDDDKVDALLEQAKSLADSLSFTFDTPSGIPEGDLMLNPEPRPVISGRNGIAGFGTLVLEWVHLSDLSGDGKYAQLVKKAQSHLIEPKGKPEAFPGLIGHWLDIETGEFNDSEGGWGAGTDSFYEYLLKMYLYDPIEFEEYKDRWVLAADSTMEHLASHPTTRQDLTFISIFTDVNQTDPRSGHLDSFAAGNFILGGILLEEQKYVDFGIELAESYYKVYQDSPSGIGPEGFSWLDHTNSDSAPPEDQADFYETAGWWANSGVYILRPETLESLYHAYRVTGDSKYQDMAWEAFGRVQELCRAGVAYSGLRNVMQVDGGGHDDFMESFWLAETLKYLYLIFEPDSPVHIKTDEPNEFVFNTEAHPIRIRH